MSLIGSIALLIGLALTILSAGTQLFGALFRAKKPELASNVSWAGRISSIAACAALTVCCAVLVICFMNGDVTILYVIEERSTSTGPLGWLYRLSGLWAGRQGSLLFWTWLISVFNAWVSFKQMDSDEALDDIALCISHLIQATFVALLYFSPTNMPFIATPASYFDANGQLIGQSALGMNVLLEHWAMAVHPPTLFIGYAGLTLPFAYALATLILGDDSDTWVLRVNGITSFAWLFLGIGIGLGAVWAYVVLGWGGYWGWDPVENASLLPWLVCTALMHSFTLYRRRGTLKRWSVVCACFAFMFVIIGTFISRSGLIQSVHAFAGDQVSLALFLFLIVAAGVSGIIAIFARRKSFAVAAPEGGTDDQGNKSEADEQDKHNEDDSSFFSMEMGYLINNIILVLSAFVLAYLTLSPVFPSWMPFGGMSISVDTYNTLARPLGILLLLIVAVGPMLGWHKTDPKIFWKHARIPAICSLVLFAILMVYFALVLLPTYTANISASTTAASELAAMGPAWYYNGLAIVGMAVACLLIFNSLYLLLRVVRGLKAQGASASASASDPAFAPSASASAFASASSESTPVATSAFARFRRHASTIGGMFSHAALGIILVGLIGSSMYVTEHSGYLAGTSLSKYPDEFTIQDYALTAVDANVDDSEGDPIYSITLDLKKDGQQVTRVQPKVQMDSTTGQQKLIADVVSTPLQDVFVVFKGVNDAEDLSLDVRVNPLISLVWVGFGLFVIGTAIGCIAKRSSTRD